MAIHRGGGVSGAGLELAVVAVDEHGNAKAQDGKEGRVGSASPAGARVREQGFRWLSRLNLRPGRYQLRVAGAAKGPERGSVRLDIDIPRFQTVDLQHLSLGIVLSSTARFQMPTFKPDPLIGDSLPGPPTATRSFARGDDLTAFAEVYDNRMSSRQGVEMSISVTSDDGRPLLSHTQTHDAAELQKSRGVLKIRTGWPVPNVPMARNVLAFSARRLGTKHRRSHDGFPSRFAKRARLLLTCGTFECSPPNQTAQSRAMSFIGVLCCGYNTFRIWSRRPAGEPLWVLHRWKKSTFTRRYSQKLMWATGCSGTMHLRDERMELPPVPDTGSSTAPAWVCANDPAHTELA